MTEQDLINGLNEVVYSIKGFKQSLLEVQEQMHIFGALMKKANDALVPKFSDAKDSPEGRNAAPNG